MSILSEQRHRVVAGSLVTQFMVIGSLFAYGVFFKELETEFGWSRTLLAAASSAAMIMMGVLAFFGGRLNESIGPRWVLTGSGLCFGLGYACMSVMNAPWQLLVLYGCFVGMGLATHDVITLSTIARWFPHKRGLMTGVVKTGTAFGQMILPPVAALMTVWFGWRIACLILGLSSALLLVLAAQGMRNPAQYPKHDPVADHETELKTRDRTTPQTARKTAGQSFVQIARTRYFWTLCALQALFFPALTTVPLHIVAHGTDLGMTATKAAAVVSVIGGASIAGRLVIGPGVDRIGGRNAYLLCFIVLLVSLLILRFNSTSTMLFIFALFYGFAHGGFFTIVSPAIAEYFDMKAHSTVFGAIVFFGTLGGATGPMLAGFAFDQTGSYNLAFSTLIGLALLGIALVASLGRPSKPVPA